MEDKNKPSKSWVYTLNNYTQQDETQLQALACSYHRYGREVGDSGTPHLQGIITFKQATRLTALKKIHNKIHWERCISAEASLNYVTKDQNFWEVDNRKQGKRTDIEEVIETLKKKSVRETALEHPLEYVKFHSGIEKLKSLMSQEKRKTRPEVFWLYGPTGTGKSRHVAEKEQDLWWSMKDLKVWEGYENQEATVFDDFRANFCTFAELLRMLDWNPYRVRVLYGSRELNSKRMYITCPYHPKDVYQNRTDEDIGQLLRRIDHILEFKNKS